MASVGLERLVGGVFQVLRMGSEFGDGLVFAGGGPGDRCDTLR